MLPLSACAFVPEGFRRLAYAGSVQREKHPAPSPVTRGIQHIRRGIPAGSRAVQQVIRLLRQTRRDFLAGINELFDSFR